MLHLVGSAVDEHYADLSRLYARGCLDANADPHRYEFHVAHVRPDGCWQFPADLRAESLTGASPLTTAQAIEHISELQPDVVVPQMFCRPGMTAYRALFDVLGIPYVGNRAEVMALGADKAKAKAVVAAAGVDVAVGEVVRPGGQVHLAPPAVVKPVDADNSAGVTLVNTFDEYPAAMAEAFEHSTAALVERFVPLGREVRCATIVRHGELQCLPLEEYRVDPVHKPVRDAADKLRRTSDGELELVAKDSAHAWIVDVADPLTERVHDAARRCHIALGCRHYGLFDFRIDPAGTPYFLEAGLYNSFAPSSVIAVMAAAAGIGVRDLFADAIDQALDDARERRQEIG
ncbi:D-alanine--D-alanine ligase [uncultured Jatrophihabitans sp.]|uniref:D-alanine--D-alanine ligase family protein n=1 Tax=uncultured Jatrophihabitans sp. TaxID=1610747 RepID=UPI0035CC759A